MITKQDLYNIVGNKISNEMQKSVIRNIFPPHTAERLCVAVDRHERIEHFQRLLKEYNEWMVQQRQQEAVQQFLQEYFKRLLISSRIVLRDNFKVEGYANKNTI